MILTEWARAWAIPAAAMADLHNCLMGIDGGNPAPTTGRSEADVQARTRVTASRNGLRLWRNNVGEEYADIDWYKAIAFDELALDEGATRSAVIAKLALRFPDKFTEEGALNRDLNAEREALDTKIDA